MLESARRFGIVEGDENGGAFFLFVEEAGGYLIFVFGFASCREVRSFHSVGAFVLEVKSV